MKKRASELIYDEAPIGIVFIESDYRIVRINKEAARRYGADPCTFSGKLCYLTLKKGQSPCPDCPGTLAMEKEIPWEVEKTILAEDGSVHHIVHITAYPWYNLQERLRGFIELSLDVTQLRLAQEGERSLQEKLKSEKAETLRQVAIGINHQINNSLTSILLNLNLLQQKQEHFLDESALAVLSRCEAEVRKVNSILERLPEVTRPVVAQYMKGMRMIDVEESLKKLEQGD